MGKLIKITLITLLLVFVLFSILADLPITQKWQFDIRLGLYLKLVSLLGMFIALFLAWGYRNKIHSSQKYRRADEVVSRAETAFERKKQACEKLEERLHAKYDEKQKVLADQIEDVRRDYQKRLKQLKQQNIELKETVSKLMKTIQQERQQRS